MGEGGVKDVGVGVLVVGNLVNLMVVLKHFFTPQGGHYLGQAWMVFFGRGVVMGGGVSWSEHSFSPPPGTPSGPASFLLFTHHRD